ncbi:hypothetical protein PGT21_020842 [Puccinia graminis f. sp. tritici]|uniref:Uncharacterized protein n=1 Tax=Puccinia graminis f. sp. tritici TaxID=56615 RepID=A0A5B0LK40_PUCGR|nr:hypothetical protein PGT21_020842 [Puccinia graminis f. sp. tritici]
MDITLGRKLNNSQRPSSSADAKKHPYSDSEIAKLLLLESQSYQQSTTYNRLDNSILTGNGLKTNKRFLKSVIRNVNDHNRQLERRPERTLTPAREDEERYPTRPKTDSHSSRSRASRIPDPSDTHSRSSQRSHHPESRAARNDDNDNDDYFCVGGGTATSRRSQTLASSGRDKCKRSGSIVDDGEEKDYRCKEKQKGKERGRERDSDRTHSSSLRDSTTRITHKSGETEDRQAVEEQEEGRKFPSSSKMDKYFSATYDPRLDVNLEDITDPQTGLITGGNYEDWEQILGQMKAKRELKAHEKEHKLRLKLQAAQSKLRKVEKREQRKERKRIKKMEKNNKEKRRRERKEAEEQEVVDQELEDLDRERKRRKRKEKRMMLDQSSSLTRSNHRHHQQQQDDGKDEKDHRKKTKKRKHKAHSDSDSDSSSSSSSSSSSFSDDDDNRHSHDRSALHKKDKLSGVGLIGFNRYSKPGQLREWDLGKPCPT